MKKHIFCAVLTLLLVLCLLPVTAAADETSKVTSVSLTIEPILGSKVGGTEFNVTSQYVSVNSVVPAESASKLGLLAYWYRIPDRVYTGSYEADKSSLAPITDTDEVFRDGYHYYVEILAYDTSVLADSRKLLPFKDTASGSINGKSADVSLKYDKTYLSIAAYVDVKGVYDIDVTAAEPALGAVPDYKPTFAVTDDVYDEHNLLGMTVVTANWYRVAADDYSGIDESSWVKMEKTEKYTTGNYYMAEFKVVEDNIPQFKESYRTISTKLTGSLNGKDFDSIAVEKDQYHATLRKCFAPLVEKTEEEPSESTAPSRRADYTPSFGPGTGSLIQGGSESSSSEASRADESSADNNPNTGDDGAVLLYAAAALLTLSAAGALLLLRGRRDER